MKILFLLLSLGINALAADLPPQTFTFRQGPQNFVRDEKQQLTLSANCWKEGKFTCDAVAKLGEISLKKAQAQKGFRPAAALCENQLHGIIVVGKNTRGDESSFCRFPDESMIEAGSLNARARLNDNK